MVRSAQRPASRRVIVERYTWLERVTHLVHLISHVYPTYYRIQNLLWLGFHGFSNSPNSGI